MDEQIRYLDEFYEDTGPASPTGKDGRGGSH
jgi:hypothetical protein